LVVHRRAQEIHRALEQPPWLVAVDILLEIHLEHTMYLFLLTVVLAAAVVLRIRQLVDQGKVDWVLLAEIGPQAVQQVVVERQQSVSPAVQVDKVGLEKIFQHF
jgi:hypothetical protein